ncbi:hypothetical protein FACS189494_03240 [Spirochaetia bacterium]|nr:hypothetical protein FACS189494_03240 [Spirochaetia bacterium]
MKNILEININVSNNYTMNYGKLNGWILCQKLGLPTFSTVYVVYDKIDLNDKKIHQTFGSRTLVCRADAPFGKGNNLQRAKDVSIYNINDYLEKNKRKCVEAVILICDNPYNSKLKTIIPRYELDGGIVILFENHFVTIEHVGKGFDPGDITHGKTVHNRIAIPKKIIYESTKEIYKYLKYVEPENIFHISKDDYILSKKNRINELQTKLNLKNSKICSIIPDEPGKIDTKLFNDIFTVCINKVIYSDIKPDEPFSIIANIYNNYFSVFEIWQIERSMPSIPIEKYKYVSDIVFHKND